MTIDNKTIEILDRYSPITLHYGQGLQALLERSAGANEKIIPVLGMQGVGKSTLINGLLRKEIMPYAAGETTCVPIEVSYGETEYGEVFFLDNRPKEQIPLSKEVLKSYADNEVNPGNCKGVKRIVLRCKADILKDGLTLVDLPGVGSLTRANEQTTERYIHNVATAIFVISLVPTITNVEGIFIEGAWAQFPNAIFVQNHWKEKAKEVREATAQNLKTLKGISSKIGANFDEQIITVNAHNAAEGAYQENVDLVLKSNINALADKLISTSAEWQSTMWQNTRNRISSIFNSALAIAQNRLDESKKDAQQQAADRQRKYEEFRAQSESIIKSLEKTEDWLDHQKDNMMREFQKLTRECVGYVRSELHQRINGGIVDGPRLEQVFRDVQKEYVKKLMDQLSLRLQDFESEISTKISNLGNALKIQMSSTYESVNFESESAFKWEKGVQMGSGLIGAGVALLTGSFWVYVGVTAALYFFGQGVKTHRGDVAKKSLVEPLQKLEDNLYDAIMDNIDKVTEQYKAAIKQIIESQKEACRSLHREAKGSTNDQSTAQIDADIQYLKSFKQQFCYE